MAIKRKAFLYLRGAMIFLALLLPMISLLPLGWLWLWERGWALYWLGAAFTLSVIGYAVQAIALRRSLKQTPAPASRRDRGVGGRRSVVDGARAGGVDGGGGDRLQRRARPS